MPTNSTTEAGLNGSLRRARRSFWIVVAIAVLAAGWLSTALGAGPSPLTGVQVAASGIVLTSAVVLAARVLAAVERLRPTSTDLAPTKK